MNYNTINEYEAEILKKFKDDLKDMSLEELKDTFKHESQELFELEEWVDALAIRIRQLES